MGVCGLEQSHPLEPLACLTHCQVAVMLLDHGQDVPLRHRLIPDGPLCS
jgi:hypothetical protein